MNYDTLLIKYIALTMHRAGDTYIEDFVCARRLSDGTLCERGAREQIHRDEGAREYHVFGVPGVITSDGLLQFTAAEFTHLLALGTNAAFHLAGAKGLVSSAEVRKRSGVDPEE